MAFNATVVRVLIASPSDTTEARDAVEAALHGWNTSRAEREEVILFPWRWETSAVPLLGNHPQSILNLQGADDADIVIALFGTRLGSPTPDAASGSIEEIDRATERGTPVHLYFSTAPMPNDVDLEQLAAVRDFKQEIRDRALYGEFSSPSELGHLVWQAIEKDLATLTRTAPAIAASARGVRFIPQMRRSMEPRFDNKGKPRTETKHWIEVLNDSDFDAAEVNLSVVGETGGDHIMIPDAARTVHARQHLDIPVLRTYGPDGDWRLRIEWFEDGELQTKDFTVA